jgi:hypothetical protein
MKIADFLSMKSPLRDNHKKFWTYTAIFILGAILNMVLPGWYKSIGISGIILYIIYNIRVLCENIAIIERNINAEVKRKAK